MAGGRPQVLTSLEECDARLEKYWREVKEEGDGIPTMTGLASALGFEDRRSLHDYSERNDALSAPIKEAVRKVEAWWERRIGKNTQAAGAIFWLKNHNWTDTQRIEAQLTLADVLRGIGGEAKEDAE